MADVRSMLRAERANRRITHPHASYTTDGQLLCNLCETTIKSEAAWGAHLHSTQHTLRLSREQDAAATRTPPNKKRKLESASPDEERKRARAETEETEEREAVVQDEPAPEEPAEEDKVEQEADDPDVDAAELAAFERELADMEKAPGVAPVPGATISAAPMTAEEIAARAREEQSSQRGRRDDELQADKEDAERMIEEEMEQMEGLEERVRKLKEKREALRIGIQGTADDQLPEAPIARLGEEGVGEVVNDNEDEDDDDDYDDWHFGST